MWQELNILAKTVLHEHTVRAAYCNISKIWRQQTGLCCDHAIRGAFPRFKVWPPNLWAMCICAFNPIYSWTQDETLIMVLPWLLYPETTPEYKHPLVKLFITNSVLLSVIKREKKISCNYYLVVGDKLLHWDFNSFLKIILRINIQYVLTS